MYNILICDDERDIVNALKIYLADPGYTLFEAHTGQEALDVLDREDIDISDVGGVTDPGQAEAIAHALRALLEQRFDGVSPLRECLDDLEALLDEEGLDALTDERERPAFLVRPRMVDVAAAVSRYRKLELAGRASED